MGIVEKIKAFLVKQDVHYVPTGFYDRPRFSIQQDRQFITEAYYKIVWVYSAVTMISSCVSSVPWVLYRKNRNGELIEIVDHPILTMINKRANDHFSSHDFFDLWATYLALQGKFFAVYDNPVLPTKFSFLYPHFTFPIPNIEDFVSGFEYRLDGQFRVFEADRVMWSRFTDPLDAYQGLSPVRAMARTIDTENSRVDWNKGTLENAGVPPGAFQMQNPSPDTIRKVREDWIERYGGSKNARIPLVLNTDKASWVNFGLTPIDMDFLNQSKISRIEIASGFGVPGQVIGDPEGQTYANFNEALKAFWQNTIIPRYLDHMKDVLNRDLAPRYADNLVIDYDLENIEALHESQDAIAERARSLFTDNLLTKNEARYLLGYEEVENGDMFSNELGMAMFNRINGTTNGTNDGDRSPDEQENNPEDKKDDAKKKAINMNNLQKVQYWMAIEKKRGPLEDEAIGTVKNRLEKERIEILKSLRGVQPSIAATTIDEFFNSDQQQLEWKKAFIAIDISVINRFGNDVFTELNNPITKESKQTGFNPLSDAVTAWIATNTAEKVVNVTRTTRSQLKRIVERGLEEGQSIQNISKNIDTLYLDQIIPNRSTVIARTEVVAASNKGSIEGARQVAADIKKIWIPTFDQQTRDSHLDMGGHPAIGLDQLFDVNGSPMMQPGDPTHGATPEEIINCRCAVAYER